MNYSGLKLCVSVSRPLFEAFSITVFQIVNVDFNIQINPPTQIYRRCGSIFLISIFACLLQVVGAGEIRCLTPAELRGRSVLTLADWELQHHGGQRQHQPGSQPTPVHFGPVRLVTVSTLSPFLRQRPGGGSGQLDLWQQWSASDDKDQVPSRSGVNRLPLEDNEETDAEFDFVDRSDDVFRGGPRWNMDDENIDVDALQDTKFGVGFTGRVTTTVMTSRRSTTTVTTSSTSGSSPSMSGTRVFPVERRQLDYRPRTTHVYYVPESETTQATVSSMATTGGRNQSSVVTIALSATVITTIVLVVIVVLTIIRITTTSNNRQQKQLEKHQHQLQHPQSHCCNNNRELIVSAHNKCVLVNSPTDSSLRPAHLDAGKHTRNGIIPGNNPRHQRYHQSGVVDKQQQQTQQQQRRYELIDSVVTDDVINTAMTSSNTATNGSAEALSLIPGRDINHEGPHLVYQWTDF